MQQVTTQHAVVTDGYAFHEFSVRLDHTAGLVRRNQTIVIQHVLHPTLLHSSYGI